MCIYGLRQELWHSHGIQNLRVLELVEDLFPDSLYYTNCEGYSDIRARTDSENIRIGLLRSECAQRTI